MDSKRVTVTQVATLLVDQGGDLAEWTVALRNIDAANNVNIGGLTVTATTGFELRFGETKDIRLGIGDKLYGICGAGLTAVVEIIETELTGD